MKIDTKTLLLMLLGAYALYTLSEKKKQADKLAEQGNIMAQNALKMAQEALSTI